MERAYGNVGSFIFLRKNERGKTMDNNYQEVYFDQYCKTCEHEKLDDAESPCNECLEIFVNIGSLQRKRDFIIELSTKEQNRSNVLISIEEDGNAMKGELLMEDTQFFTDIFSVGYDNKSGNAPVLVIGRNTDRGIHVVNVFKGETAEEIYKQLITPNILKL